VGTCCWRHGSAGLLGTWTLTSSEAGTFLVPEREPARKREPKPAQKWAVVELVKRGVVRTGIFFGSRGHQRLLRRIEREGVKVIPVRVGALVRVVMFEAPAQTEEAA
jgi:hypothetical protein